MLVILSGIVILAKLVQLSNALSLILVNPSGMMTFTKPIHLKNA